MLCVLCCAACVVRGTWTRSGQEGIKGGGYFVCVPVCLFIFFVFFFRKKKFLLF